MKNFRSYSYARYPNLKALSDVLARSRERRENQASILFLDNEWNASSFLAELLRCLACDGPRLDKERAVSVLARANSPVNIDDLESRAWVRVVLGRLHVPWTIRQELGRRDAARQSAATASNAAPAPPAPLAVVVAEPAESISPQEEEALRLLIEAADQRPSWRATKADVERIHANHRLAHPRTPALPQLVGLKVVAPSLDQEAQTYEVPLRDLSYESALSPLMGRALGLHWESFVRGAPRDADGACLRRWLEVAIETHHMFDALEHMSPEFRERFINAVVNLILMDPDLLTPSKEPARLLWELDVRFGYSLTLSAFPGADGSLLDIYNWWQQRGLDHRPFSCRSDLDVLIAMVVHYDDDPWAHRTTQLLSSSRERPHLMYETSLLLMHGGRERIGGLIANAETAALGMRLLLILTVAESPSAAWEDHLTRQAQQESAKTSIWQAGLAVFLGTLHEMRADRVADKARAMYEVLLLAAEATVQRRHPVNAEVHQRGADERLRVLFAALGDPDDHLLPSVAGELHQRLISGVSKARDKNLNFEAMPVPELKVLFWLLRVVLTSRDQHSLGVKEISETLLDIYCAELRRVLTDDKQVVSWLDDVPEALALPWTDLVVTLHLVNKSQRFVGPSGVSLDDHLRTVPTYAQLVPSSSGMSAAYELYQSWIRKLRLHVRILISVHDKLRVRSFDPALNLDTDQRRALIEMIEGRLRDIVASFASTDPIAERPSIFAADDEFKIADGTKEQPLISVLVGAFNRFSPTSREQAFSSWIDVEKDPTHLLTILDHALPLDAQQRAAAKLATIDIHGFLEEQFWIPRIEQVAEIANAAGNTEIVEKVLAYGEDVLRQHPKRSDWGVFAYRMRLMLAYHKGDLDGLDMIPRPPAADAQRVHVDGGIRDPSEESKLFYKGLLLLKKDDPQKAHEIFDGLVKRRSGFVADAVNRFAAAINIAKRVTDAEARKLAFLRALHEWEAISQDFPASDSRDHHSLYSRLVCYDGAERDDDFDALWATLDVEQRAQIDFVSLAIENARRRNMSERAGEILRYARPYHTDSGGKVGARFEQIEKASRTVAAEPAPMLERRTRSLGALRNSYLELYQSTADDAVQIVGGEDKSLHEYLWDSLLAAAKEFLVRVPLFVGLKSNENKCNDIIVSLLRMRFALIGWRVEDQSRGGTSTAGSDAGERDWVLRDATGERAIFEALRLASIDTNYIDKHVNKCVFNYNTGRLPYIYIVVYYVGDTAWSVFWQRYVEHVKSTPLRDGALPKHSTMAPDPSLGNAVRMVCLVYERDGYPLYVYHVAVNLT